MKSDAVWLRITMLACALTGAGGTLAHHSTAAEFTSGKPVSFTGTVQKVVWMNPHIYTYVEVKQPDGTSFVYHVEGTAPNTLFRQGWRKDSLPVGTVVSVSGWRSRNPDSPNVGQATMTSDGRKMFSGDGPAKAAE
jgi:hypothetical protein